MKLYTATLLIALAGQQVDGCATPSETGFFLSDPAWIDGDKDGRWEPGEDLQIVVTLNNNSGEDFYGYPGVIVTTDSPWVEMTIGESWLYGIQAGDAIPLSFEALALDHAPSGTVVTFTAVISSLSCESDPQYCIDAEPLVFSVPIE